MLTVVTNPVRALQPHTTYAEGPGPFADVDVQAVKPALLYADKVHLRSYLEDIRVFASRDARLGRMPLLLVTRALSLVNWPPEMLMAYNIDVSLVPPRDEVRGRLNEFFTTRDFDLLSALAHDYESFIDEALNKYFRSAHLFAQAARPVRLDAAVNSGLLTVAGWSDDAPDFGEDEQEYVNRAADFVLGLVESKVGPLAFEAGAADMLGLQSAPHSSKDEALQRSLLESLPTFSKASLDEILDIRKSLAGPLSRFRCATARLAADLPAVEDPSFDAGVRAIYRRDISPALAELDELSHEDSYLMQLRDAALDVKGWLPAAGAFAIGLTSSSGVVELLTAAAGASTLPVGAAAKTIAASRARRKSEFFFLWSVGRPGLGRS